MCVFFGKFQIGQFDYFSSSPLEKIKIKVHLKTFYHLKQ